LIVLIPMNAGFCALLGYAFVMMMRLEGDSATTALTVYGVLWAVSVAAWVALISIRLRPMARWVGDEKTIDSETLLEIAATAYRMPFTVAAVYSLATFAFYTATGIVLYVGYADTVPLGASSVVASVLAGVGIMFASVAVTFPVTEKFLAPLIERVSLAIQDRGLTLRGRGLAFSARLVAFALCLVLSPTLYSSATLYMNDAQAGQRELKWQAEHAAAEVALGNNSAARVADGQVFTFDAEGNVTDRETARALADRPRLARMFERAAAAAPAGAVTHPRDGVIAYRTQGDRRIGVLLPRGQSVSSGTAVLLTVFLVIAMLWGPLTALFLASSTAVPVVRVSNALACVGQGEVSAAPKVPVYHQDEVGALAQNYNNMLDQLRLLAQRTNEVSKGALDVDFEARGDLGEAFRGQVTSLREIVGHIAQSASQLAGAASEMYAAAQEQEAAAQQQSVGVEEVSRTMESLLAAATHVTESTLNVLNRAERTRETTSRTVERITDLSAHANRIGEILETIREIADRSDLLALNASLEGTRAGEAGRGFALVAAEMRKLAERVTASVIDIKKLVSDVRSSVSATVLATEESSRLAEGTTESARQINLVTQQQRSGTEQAGQSMRDVASMITQSLAATQQVRSLAEDLKGQADNLNTLVSRFRLPTRRPDAKV
jgi:methyl-accepting chemotaxis protein